MDLPGRRGYLQLCRATRDWLGALRLVQKANICRDSSQQEFSFAISICVECRAIKALHELKRLTKNVNFTENVSKGPEYSRLIPDLSTSKSNLVQSTYSIFAPNSEVPKNQSAKSEETSAYNRKLANSKLNFVEDKIGKDVKENISFEKSTESRNHDLFFFYCAKDILSILAHYTEIERPSIALHLLETILKHRRNVRVKHPETSSGSMLQDTSTNSEAVQTSTTISENASETSDDSVLQRVTDTDMDDSVSHSIAAESPIFCAYPLPDASPSSPSLSDELLVKGIELCDRTNQWKRALALMGSVQGSEYPSAAALLMSMLEKRKLHDAKSNVLRTMSPEATESFTEAYCALIGAWAVHKRHGG